MASVQLRSAEWLGISTALIASGGIAGLSKIVPTLMLAPTDLMLSQWKPMFEREQISGPIVGLCSSVSFLAAALTLRSERPGTTAWKTFAWIAVLPVSVLPYSLLFMTKTNNVLLNAQASTRHQTITGGVEKNTQEAIRYWRALNLGRSLLPLVAGGLGLWTALSI